MDIKRKISILSSCAITVILLILALGYLNALVERKDSKIKFEEFYNQEENFDVLFLGTSHMHNGVSPMDLWEQNGIVSYNLSTPGCRIATAYWTMKIALEYTEPKLVVLDCAYLKEEKVNDNVNYSHRVFDNLPLGKLKIESITDLYDTTEERLRYLFPFSIYHNRWMELEEGDFSQDYFKGRMGFAGLGVSESLELPEFAVDSAEPVHNVSTEYLERLIEECKQNQIELLLTYLPFNADEINQNDAAYIAMVAKENDLRYITPKDLIAEINPETDFTSIRENNAHLNFSGAHKVSYYIGNYIMEHYEIKDQRENPEYAKWHDSYKKYRQYKLNSLQSAENYEDYLMLSSDRNYHSYIEIRNLELWKNERFQKSLVNLGVDLGKASEKTNYLVIKEGGAEVEYYEEVAFEESYDGKLKIETVDKDTEEIVNTVYY